MPNAHDAKKMHGVVGATLLESGRRIGPWQAAKTTLGMAIHLSVVAGFVVLSSLDFRRARDNAPDEPRPMYLAPEKRDASAAVQERLSQISLSEAPPAVPTEEDAEGDPVPEEGAPAAALGSDEAEEITVPAPGLEEFVLTEIEVDSAVIPDPNSGGPIYPMIMLDAGIEGEVLARFVVDTTGRAVEESFIALQSSHSAFTGAVKDALKVMKFRPARLGGVPVAQLVVQSFMFRIQPPDTAPVDTLVDTLRVRP